MRREETSKTSRVLEAALLVGRHWNDQEGVNAVHLDALARAVAAYDLDHRFAAACRKWETGRSSRSEFLSEVSALLEANPEHDCPVCGARLSYEEAKEHVVDCPGPTTPAEQPEGEISAYRRGYKEGIDDAARELLSGQQRDDRLRVAIAALAADIRRRPLPEIRGEEMRCDECDPSFGCFSAPELCCKKFSP